MAVPEFYYFIRPALQFFADNKSHHNREVEAVLVEQLGLSKADREELLPSKRQTRVYNRITWAITYLKQAKLLESAGRGISKVTARGLQFLTNCPEVIRPADLMQFPEFAAFQSTGRPASSDSVKAEVAIKESEATVTPDEIIDTAFRELNETLARDLQENLKAMLPARFEGLIVQLMLRLGYGGASGDAGRTLGRSGDNGVDGVISQDKLGLDKIYLQAKRYTDKTVSREEVQAFAGALAGQQAVKGVFITTSVFSEKARQYAQTAAGFKISLIDGFEVARLMIEYDLGVTLVQRYDVKRVDSDFFTET